VIPYLAVFVFAFLEGEIYYTAMCVAVAAGKLNWLGVMVAGACGGATGDQLWFYLLRGRIHWFDRYPRLRNHRDAVVARVQAHQTGMLLVSRFLAGLRVAIAVACAYADVRPLRFSLLNLTSAFMWAGAIMLVVIKLGPDMLDAFGLNKWWGPIVPAVLVLLFFRWLGRRREPVRSHG